MDRSNVRDNIMRGSYVFNNTANSINRSFISTALISDSLAFNDDLRKSRIMNLPNYKKIDLGNNLQFIVVFQTIEIQRLSNQVQVLRMKLTQVGRQLFNVQNYEVQIKELNEKCFHMERLREQYCEQIEKLGKICQTLYHQNQTLKQKLSQMDFSLKQKFESEKQKNAELTSQLQKWKARYQAMQKSKTKQLQDLRNLMENQRKSMIDREIREITIRFQNERGGLQNQIRKCRQLLDSRNRQIDDLKQKCQKYQINIMELRNYENVISDNENKIVLLNQELMRVREVLSKKDLEIQDYKQKQFKLNQQLKAQQDWQHQNKQLKNALQNRGRQVQQWRIRSSRLEDEVGKGREMIHYNQQLTEKLNVSGKQIERLNKIFRTKLDEIEDLKGKLSKRDSDLSRYRNLQNQIANYESKLNMMQAQNDRINGILKSRLGQIEDWKNKYIKMETTVANYSTVDREKRNAQDKLNNQIKNNEELQFVIKKMQKDLNGFRNFQNQFKEADRQNGVMSKQIERLNGIVRNYSNELDDYRTKQGRMEKTLGDFRNAEIEIKDLGNKINMMTQQRQRLNNLLRSKNDDIKSLENEKLQLHSKINHYKNYEMKINQSELAANRLKDDITRARKQVENWQNRAKEFQNKARELENHLYQNNSQKQKLSSMIKNKNNQYDELRSRFARLQGDNRKITDLEAALKQQHNQILAYISDIEHLERNIKDWEIQLQKQKQVSNQFAYKIIVLSCEIQRMSGSNGQSKGGINSREYQQLQQDYSRLQSKVTSKNNEIDILNTRISNLQQKVRQLSGQFNRLLQEAQRSDQQTLIMVKKVQQYQDYAKRIHILGAQIDRLKAQNKALDEDARRIRLKFADGLSYEKRQEDFNLITILMGVQLQSLRARVDQRQINIDEMRKSILEPVRRI